MIDQITDWLQQYPQYALLVVPLLAFLEACVGIGLFVSGAILLSVASFLHVQQIASLAQIVPLAFMGAFLGDQSGYWLGRRLGPSFHNTAFAQRHHARIEKTERMIQRFGWGAILFGRLMTAIRSVVPLVTGISGYGVKRWLLFDALACAVWAGGLYALVLGVEKVFGAF